MVSRFKGDHVVNQTKFIFNFNQCVSNPLWDISGQVQIGPQRTLGRSPSESENVESSGLVTGLVQFGEY